MIYKEISPSYACVTREELLSNYYNYGIYLMHLRTYDKSKHHINNAESVVTGKYYDDTKKVYIKPEYIGKIKRKGTFSAKYSIENNTFNIYNLTLLDGLEFEDDFIEKMQEALKIQEISFNEKKGLNHLVGEVKWFFIEIKKINFIDNEVLYSEKMLYDLPIKYNEEGYIVENLSIKHFRYFKILDNLFYDLKEKSFIKNGHIYNLSGPDDAIYINNFFHLLAINNGKRIPYKEIAKNLGIQGKTNPSELISSYKKQLKSFFETFLHINGNDFDNILKSKQYLGYLLERGDLLEKI